MKNFRFLFSLAALMFFGQVHAQLSVAGDVIEVTPGKSYDMEVLLSNTGYTDIYSLQVDMTFPDGIEATTATISSRFNPSNFAFKKPAGKDYYRLVASDTGKSETISGESGVIVTITLTIDASVDLSTPKTASFSSLKAATVSKTKVTWGDGKAEPYTFTIKEASAATSVDITLANKSSYNTYVSDKDLDFSSISADAEAYVVTAVTKTEATLKKVDAVPAGEGFIIKGLGKSDISVPVAATAPAATGTLLKTSGLADGDYLLAKDGSKFVLWDGTGTLPANKAFLPKSAISSSAKVITFVFDETTGINEVQKAEAEGAIYNLNGMRVSKTQKGVYIMNGRKVIVK